MRVFKAGKKFTVKGGYGGDANIEVIAVGADNENADIVDDDPEKAEEKR